MCMLCTQTSVSLISKSLTNVNMHAYKLDLAVWAMLLFWKNGVADWIRNRLATRCSFVYSNFHFCLMLYYLPLVIKIKNPKQTVAAVDLKQWRICTSNVTNQGMFPRLTSFLLSLPHSSSPGLGKVGAYCAHQCLYCLGSFPSLDF